MASSSSDALPQEVTTSTNPANEALQEWQRKWEQRQQLYIHERFLRERAVREGSIALLNGEIAALRSKLNEVCKTLQADSAIEFTAPRNSPIEVKLPAAMDVDKWHHAHAETGMDEHSVQKSEDQTVSVNQLAVSSDGVEIPKQEQPNGNIEYAWEESVWDASLFIGLPTLGAGGSIMMTVLFVINIFAQYVFIAITIDVFSQEVFTEQFVGNITKWRTSAGHNYEFYDARTDTSLVQRVCDEVPSLALSVDRLDLKSIMDKYWEFEDSRFHWESLVGGPGLTTMALTLWLATLLAEVRKIYAFAVAVRSVRSGGRTRVLASDDGPFLDSDLLLNAVALEVVLNIDEILFSAFAPVSAVTMIGALQPLKATRPQVAWRGGDATTAFFMALFPLAMIFTWTLGVIPTIDGIIAARKALCGGNRSFVYGTDELHLVYVSPTVRDMAAVSLPDNRFTALGFADPRTTVENTVLEEIWNNTPKHLSRAAVPLPDVRLLQTMVNNRLADQVKLFQSGTVSGCEDILNRPSYIDRSINITDPNDKTACQRLKSLCLSSRWVRATCPDTCKCGDPLSDLFIAGPDEGCPEACSKKPSHRAALDNASCTDNASGDAWTPWADQYAQNAFEGSIFSGPHWHDKILEAGCGFEAVYRAVAGEYGSHSLNPCIGEWESSLTRRWRPWAPRCPETCGCNSANVSQKLKAVCPPRCFARL